MKIDGQPIRDSVPWNSRCTKDPCWLNNVFLFSTEIWAEQLKKPPCTLVAIESSYFSVCQHVREQWVLRSDPLFLNLEEVEKSILNLGCDIGSNFVKSHHSAVKVAYLKVTKFQPNFGNFGNYGNYGNYGNSAILLFHDFPNVEIIAQIRDPQLRWKETF